MENLNWFIQNKKGIRLVEPNDNLSKVYLRKSRSSLNMLSSAIEKEEWEWILETSYYARYFCVYSFLMKVGLKCEIHDCTIQLIGFLVEKELVDVRFFEEIKEAKSLRVDSLYYNKDFSHDLILKFSKSASKFCLDFEEFIEDLDNEKIATIRSLIK
jgi:uncharacterized protein (UPF0332 family)